jgi:DNA polymerase-1
MRECCAALFLPELIAHARKDRTIPVFALGQSVLQSLGIKVSGYKKLQGKLLEANVHGRRVVVMPTISKRQLSANPEHFEIMRVHLLQFLEHVNNIHRGQELIAQQDIQNLTKDYVFPTTIKEVRELVDHIVTYAHDGKDPHKHLISLDTETNTLFPHRNRLKLLSVVCAWDTRKAASIPVEHSESPFTFAELAPYLQRLLCCEKPKAFHNAKYDLKILQRKGWNVHNLRWDTMLGEHLLEESKTGYYDLKSLSQTFLPAYGGYEDELQTLNKKLVSDYLKAQKINESEFKGIAKKLLKDFGYEFIPLSMLNVYGAIDADVTRQLAYIQRKRMQLEQERITKRRLRLGTNAYFKKIAAPGTRDPAPLESLMFQQSLPITQTLARMEAHGVKIDRDYVTQLSHDMSKTLRQRKIEMLSMLPQGALSGQDFNPDSPPQLRKLLFGTGYIHPETGQTVCYQGALPEEEIPRTEKGAISTNAKFLRVLVNQHDCVFAKALLEYRALAKARGTFLVNILSLSEEDGRIHSNFNIHGAATGRFSSSDPNLQNQPKKIAGHNIKKSFIPVDPGTQVFMNADAKAAEVRLYSAYSGDKNLIQALREGMDPHSFFSSKVLRPESILQNVDPSRHKDTLALVGIDLDHAWNYEDFQRRGMYIGTPENPGPDPAYGQRLAKLRDNIKRVVFGILYGAAAKKVASIVGITDEQGDVIVKSLFAMFPSIEKYAEDTRMKVRELGVVETYFGRRRRFNLQGMTFRARNRAERQAINMLIQSTSADIVTRVLISVDDPIRFDFGGQLLLTVHDSICAQIPKKYIQQLPDFIHEYGVKQVERLCPWMPVPFLWDVEIGPSYGEVMSIRDYTDSYMPDTSPDDFIDCEIKEDLEVLALSDVG